MRLSYVLPTFVCLASQALAVFNITVGGTNFTAIQLLDFGAASDFVATANCVDECTNAQTLIKTCGTDDHCVCSTDTVNATYTCEQCLFTFAIEENVRVPNTLIGSQPALSAYVTSCAANPINATVPAFKLQVPPNWDGPESNKLSVPVTVVAVIAGALLGGGSLYILSTIE